MYKCSVCGKEGCKDGNKEMKVPRLGDPNKVQVQIGKNAFARRDFLLCEGCAKEYNFKNGDCVTINKKHTITLENLLK